MNDEELCERICQLEKELEQEKRKNKVKIRKIAKVLDERICLRDDDTYNRFKYLTVGEAILIKRFIEKELLEE